MLICQKLTDYHSILIQECLICQDVKLKSSVVNAIESSPATNCRWLLSSLLRRVTYTVAGPLTSNNQYLEDIAYFCFIS